MRNKFFTKKGWLTPYAMACGYLHTTKRKDYDVILGENNRELNTFDIKVYERTTGLRLWHVVEGIETARNLYKIYCYMQPDYRYENHPEIKRIVYA